ncbi:leucyl-tRNA synthetase [Lindgomyces ingoldianus]|uniref:Leucyl-tRNA synthetase n=1 Tax=Lindgomyces ingoldianus TaxID=673940 RepID=A0ACB6QVV1_9PLEO|nr:leucyl-tRNA synthetase [Lindgomyces ingoldianus]KAF2471144.1 leucyl-tRNA synthetase [Lindgomyces ingoldianus]
MRGLTAYATGWRQALRRRTPFPAPARRSFSSKKLWPSELKKQVDFTALDAKWQERWRARLYPPVRPRSLVFEKGKAYILPMFPYPSGELHLGHLRVYTISDVLARYNQMQGHAVLHPIGWDAFGLPAENAAIERGIHPEKWTLQNIETMKSQMIMMGGRWDWDRHIFLMLHERGLAYQAESLVNYDPVDKTVLANEQVDANGCSWRSGAKVEKQMLKQWFLKIKQFQEPLLKDLDLLAENGNWPERVLAMQRNWLGRSEGMKIWFDVNATGHNCQIDVFTTRPDTLFGVQYLALSINHPIVQDMASVDDSLRAFLSRAQALPPDSKEGYLLSGIEAVNPLSQFSPAAEASIPVYVAPYVLDDYGSGAVMGVPGHDARDHAFWRANAGDRPVMQVIATESGVTPEPLVAGSELDKPMLFKGFIASNISSCGGLSSDEAVNEIGKLLEASSTPFEKTENWRLRDWLISRQRYWGTPIPIIHCASCGPVPVPVKDLPVVLPTLPNEFFQGMTGNPLAKDDEWKKTTCPKCGSVANRETDTMDTFMDSSWYFFRFLSPRRSEGPVKPETANIEMPVDVYVGGVEHAILHLLYARFISKFLATTPLWPDGEAVHGEPFKRLITQGMVHGKTYSEPSTGRFLRPEEVDLTNPSTPIIKATGATPVTSFEKMSKSKYNGVSPTTTIAKYGADVTRAHMLFQAPISDVLEWDEDSITGVQRWLTRVWRLSSTVNFIPPDILKTFRPPKNIDAPLVDVLIELRNRGILKPAKLPRHMPNPLMTDEEELLAALGVPEQLLWSKVQETIVSVTKSYASTYALNTIISDLMTLTNTIWDAAHTSQTMSYLRFLGMVHLLRMVAPVAPAVAEECWESLHTKTCRIIENDPYHPLKLASKSSIFSFRFPEPDTQVIPKLNPEITTVFMLDGKKKFEVKIRKPPELVQGPLELARWLGSRLLESEVGKEWLEKGRGRVWRRMQDVEADPQFTWLPKEWTAVIVGRGKLVNVVRPKTKGKKGGKEGNEGMQIQKDVGVHREGEETKQQEAQPEPGRARLLQESKGGAEKTARRERGKR